ncbi:ferritin heavy chain-like [Pteronotus mesoamericanus]|uniref:ferritin heavy chain-like n=1 Tax=Pteronotus mesoamericanus TaxID=1884717 RepID=UPI0023EC0725|nr:ferritin heavy chain-like [Pteronotus parnellii mesoamericanus]
MTTVSTLQVCHNCHQDSQAAVNCQINLELYASYVYLSTSYYFDGGDVALQNFGKYFLHQSHEERDHAEKLMKLQNYRGGQIFLQDIKTPDRDGWESGLNAMACALHLGKKCESVTTGLSQTGTDKNVPRLCDFIETHSLDEQAKSVKALGDHVASLRRLGAPESGMAVDPFDKHALSKRQSRELSLMVPSHSHRALPWSPEQYVLVKVTFTFSITCTKSSMYVSH